MKIKTAEMIQAKFEKQKIAVEHTVRGLSLLNPAYNKVLVAFEVAKRYHNGMRKDGKTQEFNHQLNIAGSILNYLPLLVDPVECLIAAFTHDVVEDYSQGSKAWTKEEDRERLKNLPFYNSEDLRNDFGDKCAESNNCLSKVIRGFKKSYDQYFSEMSKNSVALIVKAEDRLDNLNSMYGVFTIAKQREYAEEVFEYFIPALKEGEKNFPDQAMVYQMLKTRLKQKAESVLNYVESFEELGLDLSLTVSKAIEKQNQG